MSLQSNLGTISEKLKDAKLNTSVKIVKKGFSFNKKDGLQVVVNDVPESDQINISAMVQTILRKSLGYGTMRTKYNLDSNQLGIEYVPIPNANVASTKSEYVRTTSESYRPASAPGSTDV